MPWCPLSEAVVVSTHTSKDSKTVPGELGAAVAAAGGAGEWRYGVVSC